MNTSIRYINIQVQSFGNYMRDIWFIALIFVLISNEMNNALPFIWIGLQLVIAVACLFIFRKTGPNMVIPFIIPTIILLILFLVGAPFWLFILGSVFSIWRIQARFNTVQNMQTLDSSFSLLFITTFLLVHFICFILEYEGYRFLLYSVFVTGVAIFVGIRLFSVLIYTDKQNSLPKMKLVGVYIVSIVTVTSISVFIYFLAPILRKMFDVLFVAILHVVLIPFGPLMGYMEGLIDMFQIREMEEDNHTEVGELGKLETKDIIVEETSIHFPFEWVFFGLAAIVIIFFIRYLLKNKPDKLEIEQIEIDYENSQLDEEEKQKSHSNSLYKVETSLLRERYVAFEMEAQSVEIERNKSETVREWFKRMGWKVDDNFFQIYEEVRYGKQTISAEKAELFLKTLNETKNIFFIEKDV
ncbi:hypothetical protein ACFVR1_00905 [Psychrobacillus sp. NPDC058041]|uniref:hypothetical protein n=1 Tax=Psychrobacillus sp. NPDC058041 TaxID=3346310 RepID=UPI0036DDA50D